MKIKWNFQNENKWRLALIYAHEIFWWKVDELEKSHKKDYTVMMFKMRLVPYLKQQYNYSHPQLTCVNCTQLFIVIILSMSFVNTHIFWMCNNYATLENKKSNIKNANTVKDRGNPNDSEIFTSAVAGNMSSIFLFSMSLISFYLIIKSFIFI